MDHVFAEVELSNPKRDGLAPLRVRALADAEARVLCIPERVAAQLALQTESMREVATADGGSASVPYVGPLKVAFEKRFCYVGALVIGDEVLLGAVPMEDMDLVVNPGQRMVTVDPASPNLPRARVKQGLGKAATAQTKKAANIVELLAMPDAADVDFEPPRLLAGAFAPEVPPSPLGSSCVSPHVD